ncbi:hypothetical protein HT031_003569 [Scenedesmus sp. PABB004]|nr:hypothetical protein HT031_003569 [Scenedesmus sp. PABB004]
MAGEAGSDAGSDAGSGGSGADDARISELRGALLPRKDAAVAAMMARVQRELDAAAAPSGGDGCAAPVQQEPALLPLLTSMQAELAALAAELAALEERKTQRHAASAAAAADPSGAGAGAGADATTVHLHVRGAEPTTTLTTGSQLDLPRLEEAQGVKVLRVATTRRAAPPPGDGEFEESLATVLSCLPGEHIWLDAEADDAGAQRQLRAAARRAATFLLQVEAALLALGAIKAQARSIALTRGLGLLAKHWGALARWVGGKLLRQSVVGELVA